MSSSGKNSNIPGNSSASCIWKRRKSRDSCSSGHHCKWRCSESCSLLLSFKTYTFFIYSSSARDRAEISASEKVVFFVRIPCRLYYFVVDLVKMRPELKTELKNAPIQLRTSWREFYLRFTMYTLCYANALLNHSLYPRFLIVKLIRVSLAVPGGVSLSALPYEQKLSQHNKASCDDIYSCEMSTSACLDNTKMKT